MANIGSVLFFLVVLNVSIPAQCNNGSQTLPYYSYYGLDINKVIQHDGFLLQTHEVVTDDGYILTLHRIQVGTNRRSNKSFNKFPVLLNHGLLGSSEALVTGGPNKGMAYILAKQGYDVWMLNSRGTWHSRKHTFLNPDEGKTFWQFSLHELGYYDLPAAIDYILKLTKRKRLHIIGHSQGTTITFIMCSSRPEYNDKISLMIAMAPSAILKNLKEPLIRRLAFMYPFLMQLADILQIYEILPSNMISNDSVRRIGKILCIDQGRTDLCTSILKSLALYIGDQLNLDTIPQTLTSAPGGCSVHQAFHYSQLITKGKFHPYDWGKTENLRRYNSTELSDYNLSSIRIPVSLIYGDADMVVTKEDVATLSTLLPNVVDYYRVPYDNWTHLDFMWATDVVKLVFNHVLDVMKEYSGV